MKVALATIGLILGLTGIIIGLIILLNPQPFYDSLLGVSVLLLSIGLVVYSIWSLYRWGKAQKENLKQRILSEKAHLVAHWSYNLSSWKAFYRIVLKKEQKNLSAAVWIFAFVVWLVALLVMYLDEELSYLLSSYTLLAVLILAAFVQYLVFRHCRRKQQVFFGSSKPEIHLSLHGLLINHRWTIAFREPSIALIKVEKVNLHQENCLCFTVKHSSGEGEGMRKHHVPIPKREVEDLPRILEAFRKNSLYSLESA